MFVQITYIGTSVCLNYLHRYQCLFKLHIESISGLRTYPKFKSLESFGSLVAYQLNT